VLSGARGEARGETREKRGDRTEKRASGSLIIQTQIFFLKKNLDSELLLERNEEGVWCGGVF
jgi:hypothetical protein